MTKPDFETSANYQQLPTTSSSTDSVPGAGRIRSAQPNPQQLVANVPEQTSGVREQQKTFTQKPAKKPLILTLLVIAVVLAAMVWGSSLMDQPTQVDKKQDQSQPSLEDPCADYKYCSVIENEATKSSAIWVITDYQWTGNRLALKTSIKSLSGSTSLYFIGISHNKQASLYQPVQNFDDDNFGNGVRIESGQSKTGYLVFNAEHETINIMAMSDRPQKQLGAITIPG